MFEERASYHLQSITPTTFIYFHDFFLALREQMFYYKYKQSFCKQIFAFMLRRTPMQLLEKLTILADAAKYDVSCSSSGSTRRGPNGSIGSAARAGVCHSFTADGRCISLLKLLMTNNCIYDCAYCLNRRSNDKPRAMFTVDEIVTLTMDFYRRNYIEGLFLSSAIIVSPDYTMELLIQVVEKLRREQNFHGYIHLKAIPGANPILIQRAGQLADRLSVNLELPSEQSLNLLAPEKQKQALLSPMQQIHHGIMQRREEQTLSHKAPSFVPAGQTTQMIVGASGESDLQILRLSSALYQKFSMKRVYFSAYVPVNKDSRLPQIAQPPMLRENRLYQADWLMRFYGFDAAELLDDKKPNFDPNYDPKIIWAVRHPEQFPVEINTATYQQLIRVPGLGIRCAKRIVSARRTARLDFEDLVRMHISLKRAQYFITCKGRYYRIPDPKPDAILRALKPKAKSPYEQLSLFSDWQTISTTTASQQSNVEVLDDNAFFPKANNTNHLSVIKKSTTPVMKQSDQIKPNDLLPVF